MVIIFFTAARISGHIPTIGTTRGRRRRRRGIRHRDAWEMRYGCWSFPTAFPRRAIEIVVLAGLTIFGHFPSDW